MLWTNAGFAFNPRMLITAGIDTKSKAASDSNTPSVSVESRKP